MASLCISRSPAASDFSKNTLFFSRITRLDCPDGYKIRVPPRPEPKTRLNMSLTLHTKPGGYGSTASTFPSVKGRLQNRSNNRTFAIEDPGQDNQNHTIYESESGLPQSSFVTRLDPEIEDLIARLNKSVIIKDMATQCPRSIQVPRGYLVENEIKPSKFLESKAAVREHVKKRKREGVLPRQSKKQWRNERHGFRPQEVSWNGAVHLDGCKPSNLTYGIHPLFDRSNFDDTPDAIYDQLVPGLQLATMFLTQKICMQFWVTLAMGDRRNDPEMTSRNGKLSQRIDDHVELTDERARTVIEHINAIGESNLIHFKFEHKLQCLSNEEEVGAWGTSVPICEYQGIKRSYHGLRGDLVRSIIRIHADYYVVAEKLSQLKHQEVSQKLRFNFLFAVLIIHELAHSIEGMYMKSRGDQWIDWHSSRYYKEVYWLDWQESECGRAWEQTMLGGHIAPINNRVDGSHGIAISDWPPHGIENDSERRVWNTVSMRYIEKLFQMSTWQQSFDLQDCGVFHVPRDGATALYINSFTTMSENEEQRVAREELAEAIALANAQPAKKKRVKATGKMEERRPKDEKIIEEAVVEDEQQPESPKPPTPGALSSDPSSAQRLILTPRPRTCRPHSDLIAIREHPSVPPPPSNHSTPTKIYPKHTAPPTSSSVPILPTWKRIKKLRRTRPRGILSARRHRRKINRAIKGAENNMPEERSFESRRDGLVREGKLKKRLAAAAEEGLKGLASKKVVEARERARRRNRNWLG